MSDQATAPETVQQPAIADNSPLTLNEARARIMERPATPPEEGDDDAAQQNSGEQPDAATHEDEPSGDDTGTDDTEEDLPLIDPPASWTKDEKKAWESLPRDLQESLAERERARRADIDRRLNDVAKQSQAITAKEQAAEQARKQYEEALPQLQQAIQQQFMTDFADIKSWDDVERMSVEDPIRYNKWDAVQKRAASVNQQVQAAQQRQQEAEELKARDYFQEQAKLFAEKVPEFADPKKAAEISQQAFQTLTDLGFDADEVKEAWKTGDRISVHDHRFQLLVRKASLYDRAQAAVKNPVSKPAPKFNSPGPASNSKDQRTEQIKTLDQKLSRTGSRKDALALIRAMRG